MLCNSLLIFSSDFLTNPNFCLFIGLPKPKPPFDCAACLVAIAKAIPRITSLSLAIPFTFIH